MKIQEKETKYLYLIVSYIVLGIFCIYYMTANNSLYGDGSYHLMLMLNTGKPYAFTAHRGLSHILHYGFAYAAIKCGVTSIKVIVRLFTLGHVLWIALFYGFTITFCYIRKNYKTLLITILFFCFSLTNSSFFLNTETNITAAWFWMCFVMIYLFHSDYKRKWFSCTLLLLLLLGLRINEYTIAFSPIMLVLILQKVKQKQIILNKWWWTDIIIIILSFLNGLDGTFFHQDISTDSLTDSLRQWAPFLWAQLVSLGILMILLLIDAKKNLFILKCSIAMTSIAICLICVARIKNDISAIAIMSCSVRIFNLIIPVMLAFYMMFETMLKIDIDETHLFIPANVFLVCFSVFVMINSNRFFLYTGNTNQYCKDHAGFVPRQSVNYDWRFNWGFPSIDESMILQAYYGTEEIKCVITCDPEDPFITNFAERHNNLSKYGITISHELLETVQ